MVGGSSANAGECSAAEELGSLLAARGYRVVCGGGSGVMEAVCRGACQAGGDTIGILPGTDPSRANPWVGTVILTGMGSSRNRIVALTGRVVVAVGGRYGTLSEIAFALEAGRPVCAMGGWSGIEGVVPVADAQGALDFIESMTGADHAQHR